MNRQIDILRSHPTNQADLLDYNAGEMAEELAAARARIRELEAERETCMPVILLSDAADMLERLHDDYEAECPEDSGDVCDTMRLVRFIRATVAQLKGDE